MPKHLEIILKEMFRIVGAEYSPEKVKEAEWFREHEWSEDQQERFIEWLSDYLYNNIEARRELLRTAHRSRTNADKAAREFMLSFGWKLKI